MSAFHPTMATGDLSDLGAAIEGMLESSGIPGAAAAVVLDGIAVATGLGYCDTSTRTPLTSKTIYPIASTTKAMNATLLGLLVDDGCVEWDKPVRHYLPKFRLIDPLASNQVTVRDLVAMRTGLPRHDWLWIDDPISRESIVERVAHLDLSCGLRDRFQYNNLTVTIAGHIAETVGRESWESLVQRRLLAPLGMTDTTTAAPNDGRTVRGYHRNQSRRLVESIRLASEVTAPSGGAIHSTVEDMVKWIEFNLRNGEVDEKPLIRPQTLAEIHSPQVVVGKEWTTLRHNPSYALGWFVDVYNGCTRLSHGGLLHDVVSSVMFLPERRMGVVSFANMCAPNLPPLINEYAIDSLLGFKRARTLDDVLQQFEKSIVDTEQRDASLQRIPGAAPSRPLRAYEGEYFHPGYGTVTILRDGANLALKRHKLVLPLEHWHYDSWVTASNDFFDPLHPHTFDRTNSLQFETNAEGDVNTLSIALEPAVRPIAFKRVAI